MHTLWDELILFFSAILAFVFAFAGSISRLVHEAAHGRPLTMQRVLLQIPAALALGVVGHVFGEYLVAHYSFPALTGGALAGCLGYLGPTTLQVLGDAFLDRIKGTKEDEDAPK